VQLKQVSEYLASHRLYCKSLKGVSIEIYPVISPSRNYDFDLETKHEGPGQDGQRSCLQLYASTIIKYNLLQEFSKNKITEL
jgi:hypothetical protein